MIFEIYCPLALNTHIYRGTMRVFKGSFYVRVILQDEFLFSVAILALSLFSSLLVGLQISLPLKGRKKAHLTQGIDRLAPHVSSEAILILPQRRLISRRLG